MRGLKAKTWWQPLVADLPGEVQNAVDGMREQPTRLVDAVLRHVKPDVVLPAMARFYRVPCLTLDNFRFDFEAVRLLPEEQARRLGVLPLFVDGEAVYVAVADIEDVAARDFVQHKTGLRTEPVVVLPGDLAAAINRAYLTPEMVAGKMARIDKPREDPAVPVPELTVEGEAPAVTMVETLITQGVNMGASDIHIEPYAERCVVRYRVDGVLHEFAAPSPSLLPAVIGRIKILSGMDVAQRRTPQDGRSSISIGDRTYDLRVSIIPNEFGESTVIRILRSEVGTMVLEDLGFSPVLLEQWKKVLLRPNSICLVTGPTGSGKTTTLYATLKYLWSPELKVITIEDPVEFRLPGIMQFPVRAEAGMSFASILRSVLRHDPDIIMLGEIRDAESAEIALRASLTGHLVLSTLHTNDAPTAVARLTDMGIPGWLVLAAVSSVIAQRLVRRLCGRCKTPHPLTVEEQALVGDLRGVFAPVGCEACAHVGYRGRVAVYELLEMTSDLRQHARKDPSPLGIRKAAHRASGAGFVSLRDSALHLLAEGVTSVQEIVPILMEDL